jgi:ketosteroid isomerase-like protein
MHVRFTVAVAAVLVFAGSAHAQAPAGEEAAIRQLIQQFDATDKIPMSKDAVFWSGAIQRPVIGGERWQEVNNTRQPSLRVPGSNRSKTDIQRIEVAKAGDMAYEFSNAELNFEMKSGKKETLRTSILRVWKKEGNEWRVAAWFSRAHDTGPTPQK